MKCLDGTDGQLIVMGAHRYALGRMSYVVGATIDWLLKWREEFERNTINVMMRDTVDALDSGQCGHKCDVDGWTHFADTLWSEMCEEDRSWLKRSVRDSNGWVSSR